MKNYGVAVKCLRFADLGRLAFIMEEMLKCIEVIQSASKLEIQCVFWLIRRFQKLIVDSSQKVQYKSKVGYHKKDVRVYVVRRVLYLEASCRGSR